MKSNERRAALLEDLRRLGEADTRDEKFREALAELLLANAPLDRGRLEGQTSSASYPPLHGRQGLAGGRARRFGRLAAPALALGVLVLVMSFLVAGRGGASAEAVLRRAAAITFEPNQARHLVYDVTMMLPGHTAKGTGEIWIATNGLGKPVQATETLRLSKFAGGPRLLIERDQQTARGTYTYDGSHNAIDIPSRNDFTSAPRSTPTLPLPVYLFDGATVAQRVSDLLAHGAVRAHLLPERTIGGVTVDAVRVNGWPNGASITATLYFDAHSHLLRGFDSHGTDPSYESPVWRVRLATQTSMPRDTASANAFALGAPAGARVQPPPPAFGALLRLCGRQPKLLFGSGKTLLETCQAEHSGLTKNALETALIGSAPQDIAAAVHTGAITRAQAAAALEGLRRQIVTMLTGSRPLVKNAAPGK